MPFNWNGTNPVDTVVFNGNTGANVIFNSQVALDNGNNEFVSTWRTTTANETVTLPLSGYTSTGWNAVVDWGDGSPNSTITANNDPDRVHTYATAGDYIVRITGSFPGFFYSDGDIGKLIAVHQMGDVGWTEGYRSFYNATAMVQFDSGVCNTSGLTDMNGFFQNTTLDKFDLSTMEFGNDLYAMFWSADATYIKLTDIATAKATTCEYMFYSANTLLDLDLGNFNTSIVTNMRNMFARCWKLESCNFEQLDTSSVTNMDGMFNYISAFTSTKADLSPVADFNIGQLTTASGMFSNAEMPTAVYDDLLVKWNNQPHQLNVTFGAGSSTYTAGSAAETARTELIADGWTISDGGPV